MAERDGDGNRLVRPVRTAPLFMEHLPTVITDGPGGFQLKVTFREEHLNAGGTVHGGIIATVMDMASAAGAAIRPPGEPRGYGITLTLTVNYLAPGKPGDALATVSSLGGGPSTKHISTELRDASGVLLATASAVIRVVDWPGGDATDAPTLQTRRR